MLLTVQQAPISKKRPRFGKKNGKSVVYDPLSQQSRSLKWLFAAQMREKGFKMLTTASIGVDLSAFIHPPAKWSKKRLKAAEGKIAEGRLDVDNIAKMYLDVLNGIAYTDDRLIGSLTCTKYYSTNPRVEISIHNIGKEMVKEHAIALEGEISLKELEYMVKKANRLGKAGRDISHVYEEEDEYKKHIYFEVSELMKMENFL